ncbi:MAG: hypothetical protein COV76_08555 [Candidatus Omnitrophica bacterium CG11_big_fil_rev_8_21_14_0_20_64_10]|nr:MAG: hypothetical protein COV76_08555 [Candidatus Omnitrophica bacterium CG11_big_fil_rev_8_21_14_0_20_64_10]
MLSPVQLKAIAKACPEESGQLWQIGLRQDLALWGLSAQAAAARQEKLAEAGFSFFSDERGGGNPVGCPAAGLTPEAHFDPTPQLLQMAKQFAEAAAAGGSLPTVSVSACWHRCVHPEIHELSLVGVPLEGGGFAFELWAGGGSGETPAFAKPTGWQLPVDKGAALLAALLSGFRAADAGRPFGAWIASLSSEQLQALLRERVDFPLTASEQLAELPDSYRDEVGVREQPGGRFAVGVPVWLGRLTGKQLRRAGELAETHGDGSIRLTPRQNLLFPNIEKEKVVPLLEGLDGIGLKGQAGPFRRGFTRCGGPEGKEPGAWEQELVEYLERAVRLEEPLRIHLCGCKTLCPEGGIAHLVLRPTRIQVDDRTLVAYDLWAGGEPGPERRFNRLAMPGVPADQVKSRLERLLGAYKRDHQMEESFSDFCDRIGESGLTELLGALQEEGAPEA